MKRSQPRRKWDEARAKVTEERVCRLHNAGRCAGVVEAAHILGREHDRYEDNGFPVTSSVWPVLPVRVVPLCQGHHREYDAHRLDLFWALTIQEAQQAILDAGSPGLAMRRTAPLLWRIYNEAEAAA